MYFEARIQKNLETVTNYRTNSIVLEWIRAQEIKKSLEADIAEELGHAGELGQRLKQLNANPPGSAAFTAQQESLQPPEDSTDVLAVINGVLDAEDGAISPYQQLVELAQAADDPATVDLAVEILAGEETHRSELRGFRKEYSGD